MASKSKKRKLAVEPYIILNQVYLLELAEKIPSNYHHLLIYLGVKEHTIDQIEQDNKCVSDKAFKGLLEWQRQFEGHRDERKMIECLKKALVSVNRNELKQTLDNDVKNKEKEFENNIYSPEREVTDEQNDEEKVNGSKGSKRRKAKKEKSLRDEDLEAEDEEKEAEEEEEEEKEGEEEEKEEEDEEEDNNNNAKKDNEDDVDDDNDDDDDDDDDDHDDNDDDDDEYLPVNKCIVAGVKINDKCSSLLEISPSKCIVKGSILLKVVRKSPLVTYRRKKMLKYRLDLILTDGVTFIKGVAFEHHAQTIKDKLSVGKVYKISSYRVNQANVVPSYKSLRLFDNSKLYLQDNNKIRDIQVKEFTINDVKQLKPINQLVYLNKAVIVAVSEIVKKKRKYLRTIMLKDYTEKVMLEIWYEEEEKKVKFEYKSGDVVKATFVHVGAFVDDIHLTMVSTANLIRQEDKKMAKKLLKGENLDMFKNKTLSIKEIKDLKYSQETATIKGVELMCFRKEQEYDLVYDTCSIVPSHGKLIPKGDKLYCKTCAKCMSGQKMVQLSAQVVDDSANSEWVKIFNQCSKVILGGQYATFIKCSHLERVQILKNIEEDESLCYVFEVTVKKEKFTSITAKNIREI